VADEPNVLENAIQNHLSELQRASEVIRTEGRKSNNNKKVARAVNIGCGIVIALIGVAQLVAGTEQFLKLLSAACGATVVIVTSYFDPVKFRERSIKLLGYATKCSSLSSQGQLRLYEAKKQGDKSLSELEQSLRQEKDTIFKKCGSCGSAFMSPQPHTILLNTRYR